MADTQTEAERRPRLYTGHLTNTDPWQSFQMRPDDVVVITPAKCGTTWTQVIVCMLIAGKPALDLPLNEIAPWLDCAFADRVASAKVLDAQDHRRCIKSHAPLDGVGWSPSVTYFAVYRHPIDAHFSMRSHIRKTQPDKMTAMHARYPDDISAAFAMFVDDPAPDGLADDMALEGIVAHYRQSRAAAACANVHLLHYADLTRDLAGQVARIAAAMGVSHPPALMAEIVEAVRFETMSSSNYLSPLSTSGTTFKAGQSFFDSGSSGKWKGRLSDAEVARYRVRLAELLPEGDARWLEDGGAMA